LSDLKSNPIIVALDVESAAAARDLVRRLGPHIGFYKVGMELYAAAGMEIVRELIGQGKEVFLDLKFYDIPETVKRAVAQVAHSGVRLLTVHASSAVMRAAVEGRGGAGLKVMAVTVLTSFDRGDLRDLGYSCDVPELVHFLAGKARLAGVDGVIASPLEAAKIRQVTFPDALIVTPGVRSAGSAPGDQKRVATPEEALRSGADHIVMGRQITRAAEPAAEAQRVLEQIAAACPDRGRG
jgi:orotidine-5'-phosphate decarboxylase